MQTLIATLVVFVAVMAAMAIGVIFSGRRLSGSCGGVPGKDCTCSDADRKACEVRALQVKAQQIEALDEEVGDDGRRRLSVWNDDREREDTLR